MSYIFKGPPRIVLSVSCAAKDGPKIRTKATRGVFLDVQHSLLRPVHLTLINPRAVVAWLFCVRYDIFDIAGLLTEAGFRGKLVGVSQPLPNTKMVLNEFRAQFPDLQFELQTNLRSAAGVEDYQAATVLDLA